MADVISIKYNNIPSPFGVIPLLARGLATQ